jgi:hypothetical protein
MSVMVGTVPRVLARPCMAPRKDSVSPPYRRRATHPASQPSPTDSSTATRP